MGRLRLPHLANRTLSLSSLPHSQPLPGSTAKCKGSSLCSESVSGITAEEKETCHQGVSLRREEGNWTQTDFTKKEAGSYHRSQTELTPQFSHVNYTGIKNRQTGFPLLANTQFRPLISMTPHQSVNEHSWCSCQLMWIQKIQSHYEDKHSKASLERFYDLNTHTLRSRTGSSKYRQATVFSPKFFVKTFLCLI